MAVNTLVPSYVQIQYQTRWGVHVQTLPTLQYTSSGIGTPGTFATHGGGSIAGDEMVEDLITLMAAQVPTTTNYSRYTIYNKVSATAEPTPEFEKAFPTPGTVTPDPDIVDKAIQATMSIRTSFYGLLMFVQLDRPSGNVFGNVYTLASPESAIVNALTSSANGWAGRDNGQPLVFKDMTISLNKRLRRSYKMI